MILSTLFSVLSSFAPPANAALSQDEIVPMTISMYQQTCRRPGAGETYMCSQSEPSTLRLVVSLRAVPAMPLEDEAYEGTSTDFAMLLPGADQYMPWIFVRKSVALGGKSVIYTLRFRTQSVSARIGEPVVFETVYISEETLRMREPLMLMADREGEEGKSSKQTFFTLRPSVQFSPLIRDPEE